MSKKNHIKEQKVSKPPNIFNFLFLEESVKNESELRKNLHIPENTVPGRENNFLNLILPSIPNEKLDEVYAEMQKITGRDHKKFMTDFSNFPTPRSSKRYREPTSSSTSSNITKKTSRQKGGLSHRNTIKKKGGTIVQKYDGTFYSTGISTETDINFLLKLQNKKLPGDTIVVFVSDLDTSKVRYSIISKLPQAIKYDYIIDNIGKDLPNFDNTRNNPYNKLYKYNFNDELIEYKNDQGFKEKVLFENSKMNNIYFKNEIEQTKINYFKEENVQIHNRYPLINNVFISYSNNDIVYFKCYTEKWYKPINSYLWDDNYFNTLNLYQPPYGNYLLTDLNTNPTNCTTNQSDITTQDELQKQLDNIIKIYDNIFLYKAPVTDIYTPGIIGPRIAINDYRPGSVAFVKPSNNKIYYDILSRGQTYNFGWQNDGNGMHTYIIKNYLSTTITDWQDAGVSFTSNEAGVGDTKENPGYVFIIQVDIGIPYISFDNNPFQSYFNLQELEVLLCRGCCMTTDNPNGDGIIRQTNYGKYVKIINVRLTWPNIPIYYARNKVRMEQSPDFIYRKARLPVGPSQADPVPMMIRDWRGYSEKKKI